MDTPKFVMVEQEELDVARIEIDAEYQKEVTENNPTTERAIYLRACRDMLTWFESVDIYKRDYKIKN